MAKALKPATDKVLDYIEGLPDWSRKICKKLRRIIRAADPSLVEEWKWGPHYSSNGMVCGFGAFQKHVKLTFFNGSGMKDSLVLFNHCTDNEFSRSIKFTDGNEIDADHLTAYVQEAVALNQSGFKRVIRDKTVEVPEELRKALSNHKKALQFFDGLSYGYKKDFVEHVTTARQEKTRQDRIAKVVAYCREGRRLNDQYK